MNSKEHPCPDCRYPKRIDEDYCPTCPFGKLETEQKSKWSSLFDFGGEKPKPLNTQIENPFPQIQPTQNIKPNYESLVNKNEPIHDHQDENPNEGQQNYEEIITPKYEQSPSPPPLQQPPFSSGRPTMLPGQMITQTPKNTARGTFNPYTQPLTETPKFKLTSIPRHTETTGNSNDFEGESVILKRSNLDKENFTISSQEHATVEKIENKWYISNKSSLKTTYIQVNSMTEIRDGDVVLIGDRMFIFRPE